MRCSPALLARCSPALPQRAPQQPMPDLHCTATLRFIACRSSQCLTCAACCFPAPQDLSDMLPMSPNVDMLLAGTGDHAGGGSGDFWDPLGSLPSSQGGPPEQQQQRP